MTKTAEPDSFYQELYDRAATTLCNMGVTADQLVHLLGFNVSGTRREGYSIVVTALGAVWEHLRNHERLPTAQEKAVYAYAMDAINRNCRES